MSLDHATARADSVREECLCVRFCDAKCSHHGRWHNHADEVCPIHPDTIVEV